MSARSDAQAFHAGGYASPANPSLADAPAADAAAARAVELRAVQVTKHFGGLNALDDVSLDLRPGEVHGLLLSATTAETTARAKLQIEQILRDRHRIQEGQDDDFMVLSQAEFQKLQETVFGTLTLLLVGVAAISLIVGGIGVMNIMLVSVTERTREIGIRMAIGAREADILTQFLIEALVLATLGGVLGTAFGLGAVKAFSTALKWQMTISPTSLALALGTSSGIGLLFGFLPARRAAKLDPIKALGRE